VLARKNRGQAGWGICGKGVGVGKRRPSMHGSKWCADAD